jgi:hypothetical protein
LKTKKVKAIGCSIKWADKRKSVENALADWAKEPVDVNFIDANGIRELMGFAVTRLVHRQAANEDWRRGDSNPRPGMLQDEHLHT